MKRQFEIRKPIPGLTPHDLRPNKTNTLNHTGRSMGYLSACLPRRLRSQNYPSIIYYIATMIDRVIFEVNITASYRAEREKNKETLLMTVLRLYCSKAFSKKGTKFDYCSKPFCVMKFWQ